MNLKPDLPDALEMLRSAFGPVKKVSENNREKEEKVLQKIGENIRLQVTVLVLLSFDTIPFSTVFTLKMRKPLKIVVPESVKTHYFYIVALLVYEKSS